MAAVSMLLQARRDLRRQRVFRDRNNPLDFMDDDEIRAKYRLSRPMIMRLCDIVREDTEHTTRRSRALPVSLQVLIALRFYATGSFQTVTGDVHGASKSTVSRVVNTVTASICHASRSYIFMPRDEESLRRIMRGFHELASFPNVIGAIDGTHIRIKAPSTDEVAFVNRKRYHSINVQGVCDSDLRFRNIVAKWPGSTHDAFIFTTSQLCHLLERRDIPIGWLVGDSGYPLRPDLLTPINNPSTPAQRKYNQAFLTTRNTIERAFGVLKMRFRCVDTSGGALLFTPSRICRIVVAVAVLHNMCIENRLPIPDGEMPAEDDIDVTYVGGDVSSRGVQTRTQLVEGRFNDSA